jgi:hypothetical protein
MPLTSPVHRLLRHPTSQHIYLASSSSIHKYNLDTCSIDGTYTSPGASIPQYICVTDEWIFFTGGEKALHVLNAHTLESVASLYFPLSLPCFPEVDVVVIYLNERVRLPLMPREVKSS